MASLIRAASTVLETATNLTVVGSLPAFRAAFSILSLTLNKFSLIADILMNNQVIGSLTNTNVLIYVTPHPPLPLKRLCRNNKNRAQTSRKRRSGEKVLERQPFICNIQTVHLLEMTPLSTSIVYPFLKDRILRLWNQTVSSTRATIATQPQRGGGSGLPVDPKFCINKINLPFDLIR